MDTAGRGQRIRGTRKVCDCQPGGVACRGRPARDGLTELKKDIKRDDKETKMTLSFIVYFWETMANTCDIYLSM